MKILHNIITILLASFGLMFLFHQFIIDENPILTILGLSFALILLIYVLLIRKLNVIAKN